MTKQDSTNSPSSPSVQVIERMFTLIDVLASREEAMTLKEISDRAGLHPSTAHRILNDLVLGRFADRTQAGSYRLQRTLRHASRSRHRGTRAATFDFGR